MHPGALFPAVTQANLKSTVCRRGGYTGHIRPQASITGRERRLNAATYGYADPPGDAEYDHLVSLERAVIPTMPAICGWSRRTRATGRGDNKKGPVETKLHTAVCTGKIALAAAQRAIATDWITSEHRLHLG